VKGFAVWLLLSLFLLFSRASMAMACFFISEYCELNFLIAPFYSGRKFLPSSSIPSGKAPLKKSVNVV